MKFIVVTLAVALLFLANLFWGSVPLSASEVTGALLGGEACDAQQSIAQVIVLGSRLPAAVTALLAGAGLSVAGLLLQTAFRNPLAGPSILGINSGASLGVALVMLLLGGTLSAGGLSIVGNAAVMAGAFAGSILIMGLLLMLSTVLRNTLMLLIAGIMTGYLASSAIMLLSFVSSAEGIQSYVMWGMSSFNGVTPEQLPLFAAMTGGGLVLSLLLVKPLNLLLLGDGYARSLGLNLTRVRNRLLLATGILTAAITACCGPVSFIGLSVPHIARLVFPTDNHRTLLPATMLVGAGVALACNLVCVLPSVSVLPLNAVTPLIGAPVVIWIIIRRK